MLFTNFAYKCSTDYELACGFERDLIFLTTEEALSAELPTRDTYPEKFRCPCLEYSSSFGVIREILNLNVEVAQALDDVRFLILSIATPMLKPEVKQAEISTIVETAACRFPANESYFVKILTYPKGSIHKYFPH